MMRTAVACWGLCLALAVSAGERPYEMVWANRTHDDHPALLPLTDAAGWRVETVNAEASVATSTNVLLFGDGVMALTFRSLAAANAVPEVRLLPPAPVAVTDAFDTVTCWIYGDNHCYINDPKRPSVTIEANFLDAAGKPFAVLLSQSRFSEWFLCHRRLPPARIASVAKGGTFVSLTLRNGTNRQPRTFYFTSLAAFMEPLPPLVFQPRAKRGFQLFPDCPQGVNTGNGRLPFPTSPDTVIPTDAEPADWQVTADASARILKASRAGEVLEYRLPARAGSWDDLALRYAGGEWMTLGERGGLFFPGRQRPEKDETVLTLEKDGFRYRGKLTCRGLVADVSLHAHLKGRSLVFDFQARGGTIAETAFGWMRGIGKCESFRLPYYTYLSKKKRPVVRMASVGGAPLFFTETIDWTQSNASEPYQDEVAAASGGTRYLAKTDGRRNDVFERFVFTCSRRFEDVLPNIPNPVSPWKRVTGAGVWNARGEGDRAADSAFWRGVRRYGMSKLIVSGHEVGWRDGDESFTFRTRPAPKKGGDAGAYRFARVMEDELGFRFGPYNNYTDFAPVNEYWSPDLISRCPDGNFVTAWERCYAPKPSRAVEYCERLAPLIQKKFRYNSGYCDVHTCVTPWERTDYDARVPGAGTFAATFYAFGEIMLLQKAAWNGPVYSEGGEHFLYCGLTDGNYAQDQDYRLADHPWLVDFDLRKLHPLCCNFGMGNPGMFYPENSAPADSDVAMDRFLSATVAFGHPGYFFNTNRKVQMRSYYLVQALAARYTQADASTIQYEDAAGRLHEISAALANGCYAQNQIVTVYRDGTRTAVNGNKTEPMSVPALGKQPALTLPPNGYCGVSGDGAVSVFSGLLNGRRADCVVSPDYVYIDGRGTLASFPSGACDGQMVILPERTAGFEVIVNGAKRIGVPFPVKEAVALDRARQPLGPASIRKEGSYFLIEPVASAVSYRVR